MSKLTSEHWSAKARKARELEANWSEVEPKLARDRAIAAKVGLSRQSLRNYVKALDFVERVRITDPTLAKLMLAKAPAALNEIERAEREVGAKALALLREMPGASTAKLILSAQKLRSGKRRRVTEGRTLGTLLELLATRQKWWRERSTVVPQSAGLMLSAAMEALRHPTLPLDYLTFSEPTQPFYKTAGVSGLACVPVDVVDFVRSNDEPSVRRRPAPGHEWTTVVDWSRLVDVDLPYAAVLELPNYSDLDHYRWAAKDSLYRAVAISTLVPLVIILLPSPILRDIVSEHAPALPDDLMLFSSELTEMEEAMKLRWPEHEKTSNWRLVSKPGGAILYTCPQTAHIDLFGVDGFALSRMKYGEPVEGDEE